MTRDPVCGMVLDPRRAGATAEHAGRLYYFCSQDCRSRFLADPQTFADAGAGMRLTVGVMGSASDDVSPQMIEKARALGAAIGSRGYALITGACPGIPYECARGACEAGGLSVGISPALSLDEHVHRYHSPWDAYDVIVYTGSGLMGREVTNIRSSDMVVIAGGRTGTLGEFAIAYDEGKLIGILEGSGGIVDQIPQIVAQVRKATGACVLYEADPATLVGRLSEEYGTRHYRRPSCFCVEPPSVARK
ncbi:MAG: YHS domain-containing protein [Gammaproteobacteria bacterium]|nr:YHS domain-containing protein [Gammaproteobacteria bacterium]NIR84338.1 YHS domain-containing protein [Gammaproteobacteria bacterium]NIR89854.1 YHS domain-containing protein [Gammaproteobacteria bacterium]NIU05721.1 YHS domain-containing protein [Gammaproteobacteria bacterium]NIV52481.1 YHS domain-containing protein [Gammaproteobacteria bacterium]